MTFGYIIGDKCYPFLPWLMIHHKQNATIRHIILEAFYNKHVSRGKVVIDNAFQNTRENI
jgi:hypothetical protein